MSKLAFLKKKKVYIPTIIVLLIVGMIVYGKIKKAHQPPNYETAKVMQGDLHQVVETTGKLEAVDNLALRFETSGVLALVNVKEGDIVKAGTVLGSLKLNDLNASVAQASANLQQRMAGSTEEDKQVARASLDSAQASLDQAKIDTQNQINIAESAVATAKNNLSVAQGGSQSVLVTQAYENALAVLKGTEAKIDSALTQGDNILGVDNILANDDFERFLSVTDASAVERAKSLYGAAKIARETFHQRMSSIVSSQDQAGIDALSPLADQSLGQSADMLSSVYEVLVKTVPVGTLTQATLDAKKTSIEAARASVTGQQASLVTQKQAITNAKNSLANYQVAYDKALRDLETAKNNTENTIKIRQAAYDQAQANLQTKLNPPRSVDVAYYRAALSQAVALRDKGYIRAPIDGKVTKIAKKPGELISSADVMFQLLSPRYEIQVDVPEVEVTKIKLGQKTSITLDAFGTETKFSGTVTFIEPASTVIQDVVYYKVRIGLDPTDKEVKPGMTANVVVDIDERIGALYLPNRFVQKRTDNSRYVTILENGQEKEVAVKTGIRDSDLKLEIVEGLTLGQEVILKKDEKK